MVVLPFSCITPRHTVEINDYIILPGGKEVPGKDEGLNAFIFENDKTKAPFVQYVANKYNVGRYTEVSYWVTINGQQFKVFLYDNPELEKDFDTSQFMISNVETEANLKGSAADFIAMSMIDSANGDCLAADSLFRNVAITYLKNLKDEYLSK